MTPIYEEVFAAAFLLLGRDTIASLLVNSLLLSANLAFLLRRTE
jgi:hypothetical protein